MAEWHGMLARIGTERGYKPNYASCAFKDKFGNWPPRLYPKLIKPNSEVLAWVRSRLIAYAKRRRAA